jgi:hypothetical protein
MPELVWEPVDFLELLGVAPDEEEYGVSFHYVVHRRELRLELTVWPMSGDVAVGVYCSTQSQPVVNLSLLDCPGARVINDKRGRFIEFAAANLFTGRFDNTAPAPYGFRVQVDPFVQVSPYSY